MNIWTLRKKLNHLSSVQQTQVESTPQFAQPAQPLPEVAPAAPAAIPLPQPSPALRESVGLNDLFELDDSDIREISPRLTFSTLKKPK